MFPEDADDVDDPDSEDVINEQGSSNKSMETSADHTGASEEGSSVEDPYVTADEGYEADIEVLESKSNGLAAI